MSTEANKAHLRAYATQVWNERRPDRFGEFWAEEFVYHQMPDADTAGMKGNLAAFFDAFPDVQLAETDMVADGDKVFVHWTMTATHQGEFMGAPGTGRPISMSGASVFRLADGRIVEAWAYQDNLDLMRQLGLFPPPQGA